jgi:hypothetical protein
MGPYARRDPGQLPSVSMRLKQISIVLHLSAPEKTRCLKNNSYQGSIKSKTKKKCHTVEQFQYPIVEREVNLIPVIHKYMTVHISGLTQALHLTAAESNLSYLSKSVLLGK